MPPGAAGQQARRWIVRGRVQGVFFRAFTREAAQALGVRGWARNLPDGTVEVVAAGAAGALGELKATVLQGPPASRVEGIDEEELDRGPDGTSFEVRY